MWGVGLHAACIRVPVGGVECLRQASSSSDPLPTGMGEAASSWDFTLLLSVWLQMLPLPTGCFPACAPHRYDRWRTNMRDPQLIEGWQGKTATIVWECVSDINGIFVVPTNSLCGKWLKSSKKQRKKKKNPTSEQTLVSGTGYQYNNWVWTYSVVVIFREEKQQETRVLYFFSYDMSSLVIQVLRTVSHSKQKLPKTVFFFFLQRGAFLREENLLQAHTHSVDTHIFLSHCNEIQKNNGGVCNLRHALSHLTSKV